MFLIFCFTCSSVGFSAPQTPDCKRPLGLETGQVFNGSITASSQESEIAGPENARLNFKGAWSPLDIEQKQWVQVDFGAETRVTGISTQGHYDYDTWVKSYTLRYSDDGVNFGHYQPVLYTRVTIMIVTGITWPCHRHLLGWPCPAAFNFAFRDTNRDTLSPWGPETRERDVSK